MPIYPPSFISMKNVASCNFVRLEVFLEILATLNEEARVRLFCTAPNS